MYNIVYKKYVINKTQCLSERNKNIESRKGKEKRKKKKLQRKKLTRKYYIKILFRHMLGRSWLIYLIQIEIYLWINISCSTDLNKYFSIFFRFNKFFFLHLRLSSYQNFAAPGVDDTLHERILTIYLKRLHWMRAKDCIYFYRTIQNG